MQHPNILILYTDQQRWDGLGTNGNPDVQTPHLDALAAESANFDHHFVQNPVCMPSRISFLTGRYPGALRITHMGVPVPEDLQTLPHMLGTTGYVSANIGKLHFLPHANRDHRAVHPDYGFDHLEVSDEPGTYEDAYRAWVRARCPEALDSISLGPPPTNLIWNQTMRVEDPVPHPQTWDRNSSLDAVSFAGPDDMTHTAFVAEQTIAYLQRSQRRTEPFLCIAGFYSPHNPWVAPQRFLDLYDRDSLSVPTFPPEWNERETDPQFSADSLRTARHGYYAMISEVDHHVGRILAELDRLGLAEDTIVVFTSDHGERLGEYHQWYKGYPGRDVVSRVPLLIRAPGRTGGHPVHNIVEAVDVVPTLLELAGLQIPPEVQGQSLVPCLGDPEAEPAKQDALMEMTGWRSLRTERWRYICHADGSEILWDLEADFGEYRDVSDVPACQPALAEMRRRLLQRLIQSEQPLARTWTY
ncbi:MAG: sulfatase-like hydrolase/transferase [Caldilineaceae bacterium]|nr:sulfatase-like hydrolase/transferase [Caldilineaceae bacterium]